ncbi:glucosamine-6-phosphate deaminase [Synechococcus sp. Cruz-9H2]|uniref:glucosamine-6-phosphate deaminase n=1 Tax=unclassified Synechococcus TaxID=2626047 RepID=UPI0020CD4D13|nr:MULTISPECIES: glucosamine-6-phosphate deaminase [unclassified Synechococcus]MCP9855627.1 glucosamine-6-phosphate deaminase [Synechococcus sp. Cruz-9C9]MCP9819150.1 glucosamine-6-phosphate deaminase [Synechococcus sp. Cruz-9H2]MCP9843654.1 glucosamine-6-phosphate deaminase [Synechococcus sp. Edmonson 11F2]MCP9863065.1 glucosamine-6-phosphate deaminase [Synechococcus sp. Cruz-7E5]MCP9870060.1 glucosamine-6-phosphate deaminase [Synechococcus sp. Cruz-7B9]
MADRFECFERPSSLAVRVAELLHQEFSDGLKRPLGLATGRTMEPVYSALVERLLALPADQLSDVRQQWCSFNLDEYVGLGPGDCGSFAAEMDRQLAVPLGLEPGRVRLPDGLAADPAAEARRYADAVWTAGGIGLQLLGLGSNGHVGFNEPPCGPDAPSRSLRLSTATRRQNAAAFGGDPSRVPAGAITLGMEQILGAERILLVVSGAAKAGILARLLKEPPGPSLPASWLQDHPGLRLIVDRPALGG